jgi:serine/threonine-protein kinase RsbW
VAKASAKKSLVELTIPSRPEFLRVVRLMVSGYLSRLPISIDEVENIKVAVSEACNNAIQYAYENSEEHSLRIRCWNAPDRLVFEIKDTGKGFPEPEQEPDNVVPTDDKGLGFLLIQTLMDDVRVRSTPQSGTTVTMTKLIAS